MSRPPSGRRSWLARAMSRIRRLLVGDRILLPSKVADPMWHLHAASHRVRGGEIVVRFDNLEADIRLDARSDLALRALGCGSYEPDLLTVLPAVVGCGDAINVGANVGIVAIALHRAIAPGRRLLCVEPLEECVARLRANLASASIADAIVLRAFAAAEAGDDRPMWVVPGKPEYSSGGPIVHASVRDADTMVTRVPMVCLDDAVQEHDLHPSVIVMDCEGGEAGALLGAARTLQRFNPVIIAEFDPALLTANGTTPDALLTFLATHGYRCLPLVAHPSPVTATFQGTLIALPEAWESGLMAAFTTAIARL